MQLTNVLLNKVCIKRCFFGNKHKSRIHFVHFWACATIFTQHNYKNDVITSQTSLFNQSATCTDLENHHQT